MKINLFNLPFIFNCLVNISDTTQFGQDTGGDDIYFDEQFSDDSDGEPGDKASNSNQFRTGNLNSNHNMGKDMLDEMTDSDDDYTDEDE